MNCYHAILSYPTKGDETSAKIILFVMCDQLRWDYLGGIYIGAFGAAAFAFFKGHVRSFSALFDILNNSTKTSAISFLFADVIALILILAFPVFAVGLVGLLR